MKKNLLIKILVIFLIYGCSSDDEPIRLPEIVTISILNYDIDDSSVLLRATELNNGLTGFWSLESNTNGNFLDSTDPITTFSANLFESHIIRWTISNGSGNVYKETIIKISENFTLIQLLNEDIEIEELLNEYTIQELLSANVTIGQLLQAGVTLQNLLDAEVTIVELLSAGVVIQQLLNNGILIQQLLAVNVTAEQLLQAGLTVQDLLNEEVPLIQIVEANVSSLILINLGVTKEDLLAENIIVEIPGTNMYVLNYLREKYSHLSAIDFCNNLTIGNFVDWHLPTIEELRLIFANRSQVLYEFTDEDYWSSTFSHNGTDSNGTNPNYFTKNMTSGFESTFYGFEKRIIPVIQL